MLRNILRNRLLGTPQKRLPGVGSRWRKRALILAGIVAALFVLGHLGVRFVLWPQIEKSKPTLERLISARLGANVSMDDVQVYWTGIRPSFEIKGLRFIDPKTSQDPAPLLIENIQGELSWLSFYHLAPYFHDITFDQVHLYAQRDTNGVISVAGIPIHGRTNDFSTENWLFAQDDIQVSNATIFWQDQKNRKLKTEINIQNLRLSNGVRQHKGELKATTPWSSNTINIEANFVHHLGGQAGNWRDWIGNFTWDLADLNLDQLARDIELPLHDLTGKIDTKGTLKLDAGKIDSSEIYLAGNELKVQLNKDEDALSFGRLEANLKQENDRGVNSITTKTLAWRNSSTPANLPLDNLSPITFRWKPPADGGEIKEFGFSSSKIMMEDASLFALNLPLPKKIHQWIKAANANGQLENVEINWSENPSALSNLPISGNWFASSKLDFNVRAKLVGISFKGPNPSIPSVSNLSGNVSGDQKQGNFILNSKNLGFELNDFLSSPNIALDSAKGEVSWTKQKGGWLITANNMALSNSEIDTNFNLSYLIGGPKQADQMTLDMNFAKAKLATAHRYLPISMDKDSRQYLSKAFESGDIQNGSLHIKGNPDDIPFPVGKVGELSLKLPFAKAIFRPAPLLPTRQGVWSAFNNVNGSISMNQSTLNVDIDTANYKNVMLSNVASQIPNLSAKNLILNIHGLVAGEGSEIMEYVAASPAGVRNPNLVKKLSVNGPLNLDLGLSIPLSGEAETKVDAKLTLPGNAVKWGEIPPFENLKGKVRITETNPEFEDITANFLGGAFNISSARSNSTSKSFHVSGDISANFIKSYLLSNLRSRVNPALINAMSGSANYTGLINFNGEDSQTNLKIDLRNWASSAPAPARKLLGAPMIGQLSFKTYSSKKNNDTLADWSANIGGQYFIQGNIGPDNLVRNAFGIGAPATLPQQGYAVHLVNNVINLDSWLSFLEAGKPNKKEAKESDKAPSDRNLQISAQIKKLIALDREWDEFNFSSSEKNNIWQLRLNTPQIAGQMLWRPSSQEHPSGFISGKLTRLKIPDQKNGSTEKVGAQRALTNPNQIPSLDLSIDDFSWTKANLGSVKIKSKTTQDVLEVDSIHISNPQGDSLITGQWLGKTVSSPEQSTLNIDMNIVDAGKIVARWGNPKSLEGGSGKLSAKLSWSSPIFFPAFDTLSGSANLDLAQGRLLEVNSEGAKLLDVLSLQSLFRFATLDLKGSLGNLATQGTAFSSISSEFEVAQGIAQTKKFTMILDQARVAMTGQIDIPRETQDLRITIFPTIDATGGSLAAFVINPIVGLGAVLGQYLITNQINRTMQTDYLVQGSWDKPEVIPLDQKGQPLDANTMNTIRTKNLLKEQSKPGLPNAQPSNSNSTLAPNTPLN